MQIAGVTGVWGNMEDLIGSMIGNMGCVELLVMEVEEEEGLWCKSVGMLILLVILPRDPFVCFYFGGGVCALFFLLGRAEYGRGLVLASLHKGPHPKDRFGLHKFYFRYCAYLQTPLLREKIIFGFNLTLFCLSHSNFL